MKLWSAKPFAENRKLTNSLLIAMLLVFIVTIVLLTFEFAPSSGLQRPVVITDCMPDVDEPTVFDCQERMCVWFPDAVPGEPKCQLPPDHKGYCVQERYSATKGYLEYDGKPYYGPPISPIAYSVYAVTETLFRLTIYDPNNERYKVPEFLVPLAVLDDQDSLETVCCRIELCKHPFGIRIWRRATNTTLFNTCGTTDLYFSDQFLQISSLLPTEFIYGFGEHTAHRFRRDMNWRRWPMWARDEGVYNHSKNLYGVQPFYLCLEDLQGNSHGVLLLNSNAMEVWLQPTPAVTWRTVGGILDFYIFTGPTPLEVVQQLTMLIGHPAMPPYWSLGFHLSRWGYDGTKQIRELQERMARYQIPVDVQWGDIDYMKLKYAFTYDKCSKHWKDLPDLVSELKSRNIRFIPILDPCIRTVSAYENQPAIPGFCQSIEYTPYTSGIGMDIFVKKGNGFNDSFLGVVWPGECYYPDFTNPEIVEYWSDQIKKFHEEVDFDGLWIDMNEPSNFNDENNYDNQWAEECGNDTLNYPTYIPQVVDYEKAGLFGKTMCMGARLYAGSHYNVHSLYGHGMSKATYEAYKQLQPDLRPFILTRSNFIGTGRYAFHWLGDDQSRWDQMKWSIVGMLEYNLFGISMVGADICGFVFNTTEALCRRWTQLGAFYPFSRNHNIDGAVPQDPTAFGPDFAHMARDILMERYRLLPFLYTLMYESHATGAPVVRPLLMQFPMDADTWDVDDQFLWGSNFMISPVLEEGSSSRRIYFPKARWFDYFNRSEVSPGYREMHCDQNCIPLHVRGGTIIPMQRPAVNTDRSRKNPMELLVALDENHHANGTLYLDDGVSDVDFNKDYSYMTFTLTSNLLGRCTKYVLNATLLYNYFKGTCIFDEITVVGLPSRPTRIAYSGRAITNFYDQGMQVLVVTNLKTDCEELGVSDLEWETCAID